MKGMEKTEFFLLYNYSLCLCTSVLKIYNKGVLDFRPKSKENRFCKSAESAISSHFGEFDLYKLLYISDTHIII